MQPSRLCLTAAFALGLTAVATAAEAHIIDATGAGLGAGFTHPFGGLDHLLAMLAVGLWAGQMGGRALWLVPLSFVGAMTAGAAVSFAGLQLPAVERGIAGSVLLFGALVAGGSRLPLVLSMPLTAAFAVFHGHAHAAELPLAANAAAYAAGFVAATAALHALGVGLAILAKRTLSPIWLRLGGVGIGAGGLAILAAA
jgi:urease accessory protein